MTEKLHREYSLDKSKGADGIITTSGSFTFWEDNPVSPLNIGDDFNPVPGVTLKVSKINISDSVIGERMGRPFRQWKITVEGDSSASGSGSTNIKYTFSIEKQDTGVTVKTGTMEVTNDGVAPTFSVAIGGTFNVPGIGNVTCTRINGSDTTLPDETKRWTTTYEGAQAGAGSVTMPDDTEVISYELNGIAVRSVSGEFIALRRSLSPIKKQSITICNNSATPLSAPGSTYSGGITVSERVTKEVVKVNGVNVGSYYRHDLEVEA